jgi:hypothetical protein
MPSVHTIHTLLTTVIANTIYKIECNQVWKSCNGPLISAAVEKNKGEANYKFTASQDMHSKKALYKV